MMYLEVNKKELLVKVKCCLKIRKCKLLNLCKRVTDVIGVHGAVQPKVLSQH